MSTTTRTNPIRRTAFGLATLAVAATAITIPLISTPAAQAATISKGCVGVDTLLTIQKVDAVTGEPLPGAEYAVTADLWDAATQMGDRWSENATAAEYEEQTQIAADARAALTAATQALAAADQTVADAQAAVQAAGEVSAKIVELRELRQTQDDAYVEAVEALAQAEEDLVFAEWGGNATEITAAEKAVEDATQARDEVRTALQAAQAQLDELEAEITNAIDAAEADLASSETARTAAASHRAAAAQAAEDASEKLARLHIQAYGTADATEIVTTDADGIATVPLVLDAGCTLHHTDGTEEPLSPVLSIPLVQEITAPAGYVLDETVYEPEQAEDGSWSITLTNDPEVDEPEDPAEPEEPAAPEELTPLAQTGSDIATPITFGAMLAVAGGVVASGPLLRRLRRS